MHPSLLAHISSMSSDASTNAAKFVTIMLRNRMQQSDHNALVSSVIQDKGIGYPVVLTLLNRFILLTIIKFRREW